MMVSDVADRGYAFCNCRNIFYTDWANIDQRIYDDQYSKKYQSKELDESYRNGAKHYLPIIEKLVKGNRFCEIGSINRTLLDEAKKKGWSTTRVDINQASTDAVHDIVWGDIEDPDILFNLKDIDCMWLSHLVEHLKDPIKAIQNVHSSLAPGGAVFVAMPDPYFIDWANPTTWGHWALREHHILWDMDSFIEMMEENGFESVYAERFLWKRVFVCLREYHLIFKKKG